MSIWDEGTFDNLDPTAGIADGLEKGKLSFALHGRRLNGRFSLVRMGRGGGKRENWLLIKGRDEHAGPGSAAKNGHAAHPAPPRPRAQATPKTDGKAPAEIDITHPDKVLFPEEGITKADVAAYYRKVAPAR